MYSLTKLDAQSWKMYSHKSHLVVFGEDRLPDLDRIDYVILVSANEEVGGFFTIKEMDAETAYIQHGGVYPDFAKGIHVMRGYKKLIENLQSEYKYIQTRIENINVAMIRMALAVGFLIKGTTNFKNKIYLELSIGG